MNRLFRDSYKLSLLAATIFFFGMMASFYVLYAMPGQLMLTGGFQPVFVKAYVVIGISFLIGASAIYVALKHKKEVIVFRDRKTDSLKSDNDGSADANKTTITLDSVSGALNQARSEKEILQGGLQAICKQLDAGQGAIYATIEKDGHRKVELKSGYALTMSESATISFEFGEGLIGQSAVNGRTLYVDDVPEGYVKIISGLGSASPRFLLIVPIKLENTVLGIVEIASFHAISENQRKFVEEAAQLIANKISSK